MENTPAILALIGEEPMGIAGVESEQPLEVIFRHGDGVGGVSTVEGARRQILRSSRSHVAIVVAMMNLGQPHGVPDGFELFTL